MSELLFYPSFWKAMEKMNNEDKGIMLTAIMQYQIDGIEPELVYPLDMAWELIRPVLDKHIDKKEAGAKGGKKRAENAKTSSTSQAEVKQNPSKSQAESKQTSSNAQAESKQNIDIRLETKDTDIKEKDKRESAPIPSPSLVQGTVNEVMGYLNTKLKKNFNPTNAMYERLIANRLLEGYTYKDFVTVIDKKYDEWHDNHMSTNLTPDVLFSDKFDKYLNQERPKPKGKITNFDERETDWNAIADGLLEGT